MWMEVAKAEVGGGGEKRRGGGVGRMMMEIARTEGVMALMKGFTPTYVRMGPWQVREREREKERKRRRERRNDSQSE